MSRIVKNQLSWVHLFPGRSFQGKLHRFCAGQTPKKTVVKGRALPSIGSIIVGPNTAAEIITDRHSRPIKLPPSTVLADATRIVKDGSVSSLLLEIVGPEQRNGRAPRRV
jgi:hypothetical protein